MRVLADMRRTSFKRAEDESTSRYPREKGDEERCVSLVITTPQGSVLSSEEKIMSFTHQPKSSLGKEPPWRKGPQLYQCNPQAFDITAEHMLIAVEL